MESRRMERWLENDDWSSVGWHEGWERSFSLGSLGPKRFEWVEMNLDTGAAVNTFPLNFGPEGAGDGRFYRTASGDWILDVVAWLFQGYDENGLPPTSERKTHWCTPGVVQCCQDRAQRMTRFLLAWDMTVDRRS